MLNLLLTPSVIIPLIIAIIIVSIVVSGYVKAPPDKAFIISGFRKNPKILIGRAGIKIPFLERKDVLTVKQISVDIKTNGFIPTQDFVGVDIDAIAKIRVKTDEEGIQLAMKNFLNMNDDDIIKALTDSLQGNMREIIGTVKLRELCNDRKKFGDEVQEKAQKDMNALGIEIISCNIQKLEDENKLIPELGQDNMSQIQKDASVAKAQADRDIAIAKAEAQQAANEAEVASQTAIAERNNELAIKKAELKQQSDIKRAQADAAYEIQKETSRKEKEVATANANIMKQEKEIELRRKEVEVKEQELDATIKKQADADKYAARQKADADLYKRQKEAEAKLYEQQQAAEAKKVEAEAAKFQMEQEAAGITAKGEAEAAAIRAKGEAEAETLDKKAEAMKKYGNAAIAEMFFNAWPKAIESAAKPLEKVDKITMYGDGNGTKLISDIMQTTSQVNAGLSDSMNFDLNKVLQSFFNIKGIQTMNTIQNNQTENANTSENKIETATPVVIESADTPNPATPKQRKTSAK